MEKGRRLKALVFMLLFAMVFTTAVSIGAGDDAYGAKRKNTQYKLDGAVYKLYKDAECTQEALDANGQPAVLTTDANGNSAVLEMEVGTYYAKEDTASKGFKYDPAYRSTPGFEVVITENHTAQSPKTITSAEPPVYGTPNFKVYKIDPTGEYGWSKLLNAEFTVNYYDVAAKEDIANAVPMDTWKFKTRKMEGEIAGAYYAGFDFEEDEPLDGSDPFYVVDGKRVVPIGWFTIQETDAPNGLALNDKLFYGQVKQDNPGEDAKTIIEGATAAGNLEVPVSINDEPQKITIAINKENAAGNVALVEGATLAGAKYNVYFDENLLSAPVFVGDIVTDENGHGELTENKVTTKEDKSLLPGDYIIEEVEAAPGFLIDKYVLGKDGTTEEFEGEIEVICGYDSNGQPVTKKIGGTYKNGKHLFKARVQTVNTDVFKYTVKSDDEPTRTHIKKTEATTSKEVPGARLQIFSLNEGSKGELITEWTSTTEEHHVYGLQAGKYLLREITAPKGYDVAEDIEFEVAEDKIVNKVEMKNKPIEIGTIATGKDTQAHQGTFSETAVIDDKVSLKGLNKGWKYQVKGVLMDKATKEPLKDKDGNDITAETEVFTATGDEMEVSLNFSVDTSKFATDRTVVAFEKLYRAEPIPVKPDYPERPEEDLPIEIGSHEDIDDEAQTVHFGGIVGTTATDAKSNGHNILGEKGAVIKDVVKYENLSTDETYTVEGVLYDKTTGQLTDIKSTASFKPEKADGTVELEFKFDASQFKGHSLVVFETLLINNVVINKHEDPNDEEQTVNVPDAKTKAVNPETNAHIGNAGPLTIKDTISYTNLTPNKTYTVKGTLQYRDGLFKKLKTVMKDGEPLTATATFTPTTANGTVEVTFKFNAADLAGKTVVVFENIYEGEYLIAAHADPDDEDQSVHIPKIGTKVGKKDGDYVIDTVAYKNLIPGKKYVVRGYFVEKDTGNELKGSDGEKTFKPTEPNGTVEVKLKATKSGKSLVAFESVYLITEDEDEVLVGEHKDLNDKDQTLTQKGKPATGDTTTIYLLGSAFVVAVALAAVLNARRRKMQNDR